MAVNLIADWNKHAFPDDRPAKEELWAEEAERRRVETRREVYLEQTTDLRIRRHTSDRDQRADAKAAKDQMLDNMMFLAVGSPAYIEAYNNKLSFTIDGKDFEITQGELHDRAKQRAEDLQEQINAAKRRGASAGEITGLQGNLDDVLFVRDTTDPRRDKVTGEDHQALQTVLQRTPVLTGRSAVTENDAALGRDSGNQKTQAADMSARMDHDAAGNGVIAGWAQAESRASFAGTMDDTVGNNAAMSLTASFTQAAENTPPPADMLDDDQVASVNLHRTTGLDL
tara:strand:+ start:11815 stop:12666 length:852 start_codon:yes stop_codon:yes gene_type:complete